MTTAADDAAVEDAFEALLAGRPVPEGAAGLAAFTEAVRSSATRPGRPNAALAELLATGLLADHSSPSVRTAPTAGSVPARRPSRVRTRRRPAMIFSALIAKFLSAGAVAQAATGATVAVVAFTGVGAVGALPDPVQDTFATVVSQITPLQPPTSDETSGDLTPEETVADEVGTTDETTADAEGEEVAAHDVDEEQWLLGPDAADFKNFGDWVSFGRHEGWATGSIVTDWAHRKGEPVPDDLLVEEPADGTVVEETEDDAMKTSATDSDRRGNNGNGTGAANGSSNGKGKGNGKN